MGVSDKKGLWPATHIELDVGFPTVATRVKVFWKEVEVVEVADGWYTGALSPHFCIRQSFGMSIHMPAVLYHIRFEQDHISQKPRYPPFILYDPPSQSQMTPGPSLDFFLLLRISCGISIYAYQYMRSLY